MTVSEWMPVVELQPGGHAAIGDGPLPVAGMSNGAIVEIQ